MHAKRVATVLLLLAAAPLAGCYYAHLARGQARILWSRRPIADVVADADTPAPLRERLTLVQQVRAFARALGLDVGAQYTSYVEWPGDRIVTTVIATRPGEIEPAGFSFPIVGRVPYKGFFDAGKADAEARRLRGEGHDVCVVPVTAYSTLGWFDDPVTGPMLRQEPGAVAETVLHELVHATVFAASAARFNEGFATFVGQEASVRFFAERGAAGEAARRRRRVADARAVARTLQALREDVRALYARTQPGPARDRERAALERRAREALAALPLETRGPDAVAERARLNDACLSLSGTYSADLERYARRLDELGGSLARLIEAARAAADAADPRSELLGAARVQEAGRDS